MVVLRLVIECALQPQGGAVAVDGEEAADLRIVALELVHGGRVVVDGGPVRADASQVERGETRLKGANKPPPTAQRG